MNMKQWFLSSSGEKRGKAFPILSFPCVQLLGVTVRQLISDSDLQSQGMKAITDRCDTLASVSLMDLSVEAQAFGSTIKTDDHEVPTVVGSIISTLSDAESLRVPRVGEGRTGLYIESLKKAADMITDRPVFAGMIGPFSLAGRLMDMTDIMINCFEQPEMVHLTLRKATEFLIEYGRGYKLTGASGVIMAEPAAGLLSPGLIDEFSTPYVKEIAGALKSDSFAFVYHNCGNTIPLIDSIKKIDADAYHFGNAVELAELLSLVPENMVIMGNVDPAGQLRSGTPQSVYDETKRVLDSCDYHPGFIISSGCDVPPRAPWSNIDSFFRAVKDFYY